MGWEDIKTKEQIAKEREERRKRLDSIYDILEFLPCDIEDIC